MGYTLAASQCLKRRYGKRKKQGICVKCGNKAEPNKTRCMICLKKDLEQYHKRKKLKNRVRAFWGDFDSHCGNYDLDDNV